MNSPPAMPTTRSKSIKIENPEQHFAEWRFCIPPHHYETLGVTYKQFVKNKLPYRSWASMNPPECAFRLGDLFYAKDEPNHFLQIAAEWDAFRVEVHEGWATSNTSRQGYAITIEEMMHWLQTGDRSSEWRALDVGTSKAGLLAWQLKNAKEAA